MTPERMREIFEAEDGTANLQEQIVCFAYALVREVRREALEEAAALATERTKMYTDFSTSWHIARDCAAAIRALADAPDAGARKEGEG